MDARASLVVAALVGILVGCDRSPVQLPPDVTPPRIVLSAPQEGVTLRVDSVQVSGTARDSAGTVASVAYALNSGAQSELPITPAAEVEFAFTASGLAAGSNTITVFATDAAGNRASQEVSVVYQANQPPVAADHSASVWADSTAVIPVLEGAHDPDGDPLTVFLVTNPTLGEAVVGADGGITYTPDPARSGTDSFRYALSDPYGGADTASITVEVLPLPGPYQVTVIPPLTASTTPLDLNDLGQVLLLGSDPVTGGWVSGLWQGGETEIIGRIPFTGSGGRVGLRGLTYAVDGHGEQLYGVCTAETGFTNRTCTEYGFEVSRAPGALLDDFRVAAQFAGGIRTSLGDVGHAVLGGALWEGTTRVTLPPAEGRGWQPVALSSQGRVVGTTFGAAPPAAVLYRDGSASLVVAADTTRGRVVNDAGQLVGIARDAGGDEFAFLWEEGQAQPLPGHGAARVLTVHLDGAGQVAYVTDGPRVAYLWVRGRAFPLDALLADPAWEITAIAAVSDLGRILGHARNRSSGGVSIVLLTPAG
jgi:hypothetical protein